MAPILGQCRKSPTDAFFSFFSRSKPSGGYEGRGPGPFSLTILRSLIFRGHLSDLILSYFIQPDVSWTSKSGDAVSICRVNCRKNGVHAGWHEFPRAYMFWHRFLGIPIVCTRGLEVRGLGACQKKRNIAKLNETFSRAVAGVRRQRRELKRKERLPR